MGCEGGRFVVSDLHVSCMPKVPGMLLQLLINWFLVSRQRGLKGGIGFVKRHGPWALGPRALCHYATAIVVGTWNWSSWSGPVVPGQ
jgi:hypothetical protein